jgi:glucose-1-phosphate thymidylyltransferase
MEEYMKAIIPAAGIGTRLRPHTYSIPKILLNVAGKPMISHLIDELITIENIDTIAIIVGHLGDKVVDYIHTAYASISKIKFDFIEQKEMKGLGHAVYQAKKYLTGEPVLIVLGDTIFEFDLKKFASLNTSALGVRDVEDPSRFGIVEVKDGFIIRMIEKPSGPEVTPSKLAISGLYFIKDSSKLLNSLNYIIEKNIRTKDEYQLTDALQNMIDNGVEFVPFEIQNWFDCGKPETLLSTNKYLLEKYFKNAKHNIFPNSLIIPPVFIGKDCKISNSIIGPDTTVGNGVTITESIISNTTIGDNSTILSSVLRDSIIGSDVNLTSYHIRLYLGDSTDINL